MITSGQPPSPGASMSQIARFAVTQDDGQFLLTDWIEQFQEFHQVPAAGEPGREWEDVFRPTLSPWAARRDMDELRSRLGQLAERIQALERR